MNNKLIEKIKKAFVNTQYPGDENIVHKTQYDNEVAECEKKFLGKKWQEVDWNTIDNEGWASGCAFLTNEAYRYYLPAYMIAIIEKYDDMINSVDAVVSSLRFPNTSEEQKEFYVKMEGFTSEQKEVIIEFLDWLAENHNDDFLDDNARQANIRYWKK